MAYCPPNPPKYEEAIHELMHMALDQLIDLGAKLNLHADILSTHEMDEEGNMEELPDVHPERLLRAQMGIEGAEEEINTTQELVKNLSHILITRRMRQLILETQQAS